jgi:PAS domain-containing protein
VLSAGLALLCLMTTVTAFPMFRLRRDRLKRHNPALVEIWRDAFESSPIVILVKQDGAYVHCNDAAVRVLGGRDQKQVLEAGPTKIASQPQRDGRLVADYLKDAAAVLKQGKPYYYEGIKGTLSQYERALLCGCVLGPDEV